MSTAEQRKTSTASPAFCRKRLPQTAGSSRNAACASISFPALIAALSLNVKLSPAALTASSMHWASVSAWAEKRFPMRNLTSSAIPAAVR